MSQNTTPVLLAILDGWGYRSETQNNAIALAHTPTYDRLLATRPYSLLRCDGEAVGLPDGQMGNSEVGHLNLGAGRVVLQTLPRINKAIALGALAQNTAFLQSIKALKASKGRVHILGLMSRGGVHAHQDHSVALAKLYHEAGIPVILHAFTDGRDTAPKIAHHCLAELSTDAPFAQIATLCGRYYAMDRDQRWERIEQAYRLIVEAKAPRYTSIKEALDAAWESDEFLKPCVIGDYQGFQAGDGLVMANFRADRAREILEALLMEDFTGFVRERPVLSSAIGMISYSDRLASLIQPLFPKEVLKDTLAETVSQAGLKQYHTAETEKYPHVTYFFNGGREEPFRGEVRQVFPSPKVATYDLAPEMSAAHVRDGLIEAIRRSDYDFLLVNFANPDMVGHSGKLDAAIKACTFVDRCLGEVLGVLEQRKGIALITADHGNAEVMRDPQSGKPHTAHTRNPVTLSLIGADYRLRNGKLADVAPTILALLGFEKPALMQGDSLLVTD